MKNKMVILAVAVAIGGSTLAFGQDRDDRGRDNRRDDRMQDQERGRQVNNGWYGRRDNDDRRDNDRRDNDNRWARTDRDGDHDGSRQPVYTYSYPVYNNGYYNNGYGYGNGYGNGITSYGWNQAQQVGYQDGFNAGRSDAMTGHSFRYQQWEAFEDANHGYSYGFGNVSQYKAAYRQAFQQGYQQGYQGGY